MRLTPGTVLNGRYQVDELVAEGGTSVIYRGHPLHGAGEVAIKQLQEVADALEHAENLRLFEREHELLSGLRHAALPHVLDLFEDSGAHYLVEEFVRGESLQAVLERDRRLPWPRALDIGLAVLDALSFLHEHGIIYRDLKPANILIATSGSARLIDFGAARRYVPGRAHDTVPLGTPGYASPEQYGRAQTDARSDVYGLGVVMHHMLTGIDPTESEAWVFAPPRSVVADIPQGLSSSVMRAIELDMAKRFATARDMTAALVVHRTHSAGLGRLRGRLHYGQPAEYEEIAAAEVPWWAIALELLSPVPLLGLFVGLVVTSAGNPAGDVAHARCARFKDLIVEIYEDGMYVLERQPLDVRWADVRGVRIRYARRSKARKIRRVWVVAEQGVVDVSGDWPGVRYLLKAVIDGAGLAKNPVVAHGDVVEYVRLN